MEELQIITRDDLKSINVGFYIRSTHELFVSTVIAGLIETDKNAMRKNLKIELMPMDSDGNDLYKGFDEWFDSVKDDYK